MAVVPDGPPGDYALTTFVILSPESGKSDSGIMDAREISVTVPADPPTGQLDVGTIELKPSLPAPKNRGATAALP
ncbi:MAG TPA: hypothetical protein VGO57_02460 [Verrucomicrobiae bacterium]